MNDQSPPVVAVFNSNDDTVELIRAWFERDGIVVVSAHLEDLKRGSLDLRSFVEQHKPGAVLFDIAPPYDRSWLFVRHLISTSPLAGLPTVFTTTNERHVREAAGPADAIELVGKPYDLNILLERVRAATGIEAGQSRR